MSGIRSDGTVQVRVNEQGQPVSAKRGVSLEDLVNISVTTKANGSTLVYNSNTTRYEITSLNFNNLSGNIDFGVF